MASDIIVANMALRNIGTGVTIASLSENSQAAKACRLYFDDSRDSVLRDFDWPFARKTEALALVEESPNSEWDFSYTYPTDCVMFRKILSGLRNDSQGTKVPFEVGNSDDSRIILTDQASAEGKYTRRVTNPILFPPDFVEAFAWKLGFQIAGSLLQGEAAGMRGTAAKMYAYVLSGAKANSANEESKETPPDCDLITERG